MRKFDEAVAVMEECCQLNPNHEFATNNLAYLLILLRRDKEASEACKRASLTNKFAKNYFRNWAIALINQHQYSEAVNVIKRAIDENNTLASIFTILFIENWMVWGEIMLSKGDFEDARTKLLKIGRAHV